MHAMKEIAFQAGVSLATVDRVLHAREGVKNSTVLRVEAAIRELDRQSISTSLDGQRVAIDVILEAPKRFSKAVQTAFEAELEGVRPASLRLRFHVAERFDEMELRQLIRAIRRRGTSGVIAKVPDRKAIVQEFAELVAQRIPVITFVTDLPSRGRVHYIGMDNAAAGQMAAYLMQQSGVKKDVLAVVSSYEFEGEMRRIDAFCATLKAGKTHIIQGAMGRDFETGQLVQDLVSQGISPQAVYSAGGGNKAILRAFEDAGQRPKIYIAHDLDADNTRLLRERKVDFVIHHDLRQDARSSCQHIMKALRLLPVEFEIPASQIQLATPFNMPRPYNMQG
jgi:LacI family transcriptional regulator